MQDNEINREEKGLTNFKWHFSSQLKKEENTTFTKFIARKFVESPLRRYKEDLLVGSVRRYGFKFQQRSKLHLLLCP